MVRLALLPVLAFAFGFLPQLAVAQEATHNWTGFYAGVQGGGGAGDVGAKTTCADSNSFFDGSGNCADSISSGALPVSFSSKLHGPLGGAEAGYNTQFDQWVFGVEADISAAKLEASDVQVPTELVLGVFQETVGIFDDVDGLATLRGRIGYATGDLLLFATAGLAAGNVRAGYALSEDQSGGLAIDARSRRALGWTVGAGAEMAFGAWSLKGEVLHFDLGKQHLQAEFDLPFLGPQGSFFDTKAETNGNIIRLGLNYHFD